VNALYRDIVLDHHRAPRRYGALAQPTHACDGVNALCGDSLRVELRLHDGCIAEYGFRGECCAIATATASLLGERVIGLAPPEIAALQQAFAALVGADAADAVLAGAEATNAVIVGDVKPGAALGDLAALSELSRYPARRKCALLPWATLAAALAGETRTTTEKDSA
jgi:nitrogen fixation NifU-like protein